MNSNKLGLYIPEEKVSAWVAETHPKEAAAWLNDLPYADAPEAARELYQSLYTLNRQKLPPADRVKLMALYHEPVARVVEGLSTSFRSGGLALSEKKRKLADFIRQLKQEMAIAFKIAMLDAINARMMFSRKKVVERALESALRYMADVMQSCYQVYVPVPMGTWREMHILYRYAEDNDWFGQEAGASPSIEQYYRDALLLGLCNPYQLPEGEWEKMARCSDYWGDRAEIHSDIETHTIAGRFLMDLDADSPPVAFPRGVSVVQADNLRVLNALPLTAVVQDFVRRFKKGDPDARNKLGVDCLDANCLELLRRMRRAWGLATGRRGDRIRKSGQCFVATSVSAIHYFASGQHPFVQPLFSESQRIPVIEHAPSVEDPSEVLDGLDMDIGEALNDNFIDLDAIGGQEKKKQKSLADPLFSAEKVFRAEPWQIRDESVSGIQLTHKEAGNQQIRVGDVVGLEDGVNRDAWRIGVVRWVRTPKPKIVDIGVELLGSKATPIAIRRDREGTAYVPALLLPPVTILKRPATLLVPAGIYAEEGMYFIVDASEGAARKVMALKLLERTGAFEYFVFANAVHN
ncbi:MAG: hypothetical protein IME93_02875 [Proteobacteria bacterium]|nr:hypothetical protein [Pseudomonadota bacterium]